MPDFYIKIHRDAVKIEKEVFLDLLDLSPIKELSAYTKAIVENTITFEDLKKLATKANIPYPLFFAPKNIVAKQIENKDRNLFEKIPSKHEMQLASRGKMEIKDIELILKDLGRKQEFLKSRILPTAPLNTFVGSIAKKIKSNVTHEEIATELREYFEIDLTKIRKLSKDKVLSYLSACAEKKGVLISFSSFNYMPQNIAREVNLSGVCVKDKKFPYIFINTRDADDKPKILESTGRQIFTLLSMLVCVGMGKFVLNTRTGRSKEDPSKTAFSIAGEILIPRADLAAITINDLEGLKEAAHFFRVTPSMLLFRLKQNKKIEAKFAESLRQKLLREVKKSEPKIKHQPLQINGYGKYNGERFSQEVLRAHKAGLVSQVEVKNILFRKGKKMDPTLFQDYSWKYR